MTGTLYKLSQRSKRRRLPLKQGVLDHFIVGDIDSVKIEGTFNALILYTVGDIKNLTFRNRNTHRITHLFYVRFMIPLRML